MKKTILLFVMSMMTCLGAMAQEKGPTVVETENFSVKVPKGWVVKKKSSGNISSVTLAPELSSTHSLMKVMVRPKSLLFHLKKSVLCV